MSLLSAAQLRETGFERHVAAGYISLLGVSVQGGVFTMLAARWDIYERGVLGRDPDAEAISILVLEEVLSQRLHNMTADPFDLVKRARMRLMDQTGCMATCLAVDLGGADAGLVGLLVGRHQLRLPLGLDPTQVRREVLALPSAGFQCDALGLRGRDPCIQPNLK